MNFEKIRNGSPRMVPGIVWFEFLIEPALLERHLNKEDADPSAHNLIIKFISEGMKEIPLVKLDGGSGPSAKLTKKAIALKILATKVFAFLNWNLMSLDNKIALNMQYELLRSVLFLINCDEPRIETHYTLDLSTCDHQTFFAVILYHRWVLQVFTYTYFQVKHTKAIDDLRIELQEQSTESYLVLKKALLYTNALKMPTLHSFEVPTIDVNEVTSALTKWQTACVVVSEDEFKCQLHFEMGKFCLFREEYEAARDHFIKCSEFFEKFRVAKASGFCIVTAEDLYSFCSTLGVKLLNQSEPVPTPSQLLKTSVKNDYQETVALLQTDNILQQLSLVERDLLELELQISVRNGSITVARDMLFKVQLLNGLRRTMTSEYTSFDFVQSIRNTGNRAIEFFLTSIHSVIFDVPGNQQETLQRFLMDLMLKELKLYNSTENSITNAILADELLCKRFSKIELDKLREMVAELNADGLDSLGSDFNFDEMLADIVTRSPRLEVIQVQQQITKSYDKAEIKQLILKLYAIRPQSKESKPVFRLNNKWELPIPLQSVVMSLSKGFLQDFVYILLAKSRELSYVKDFGKAVAFLEETVKETKEATEVNSATLYKLQRLVEWEILLININRYIDEYPNAVLNTLELVAACKSCVSASLAGDMVIPRLEVLESCALALLNLAEWEVLTAMEKRWIYLELAGAFAYACQDISKYKGNKKISRDAWDLILPVFLASAGGTIMGPSSVSGKRSSAGGSVGSPSALASGSAISRSSLMRFFLQLREPTCLAVATSLLARLHNVLHDEPTQEINCLYVSLWPAVVSTANTYNPRVVAEMLLQVVLGALKFSPNDCSLLKILGDLSFVSGEWATALRYYLEAGALSSEYYMQPVPKQIFDDYTFKRMIRCCSQLQCYTQAGVLCQCLDEIDYPSAFKYFQETKSLHCTDAMDAYYPCIWDLTILEFIVNLHSKRGESQRKQQVIKLMGALELNGNNNEEIQREAANLRKGWLLRALTRQYSINSYCKINYGGNLSEVKTKYARLAGHY